MLSRRLIQMAAAGALAAAAAAATAETVQVKYIGPVNLAGFDCRNHDSSFVWRTCHQLSKQFAVVSLKGTYYGYCSIPASTVRQWRASSSLGRFYNQRIKGRYRC